MMQQQVLDHQQEQEIKKSLEKIGNIEDDVSRDVQSMYEENPYPCWRYIDYPIMPLKGIKGKILVAGCGTGKMLTQIACLFPDFDITAVDISSSSLAYAKRISSEYGAKNIEFIQCDILNLDQIPGDFDFINCSGVLHHMKDPIAGWKRLVEKMSPGAMMLIGLYSTKARTVIEDAHEYIQQKGYKINDDDIRQFRRDILSLKDENPLVRMTTFRDFYSVSDVRDLVFHVQETTYDIPELRRIFDELGLKFDGFKIPNDHLYNLYKEHYPDDENMMSLDNWHELEIKHPYIFGEMYNFKCTRKGDAPLNPVSTGILASGVFNF
jgi:2-polyprenyl-3-methyl-5-hydroxy-6-metoxy-1,4-benzoquinol methylase